MRPLLFRLCCALAVFGCVLPLARAQSTPPRLNGIAGAGTVDLGQRVTLGAMISGSQGSDLIFQWRHNGADLTGATASTHLIASATAGDAGTYSVVVGNAAGTSVASGELVVLPAAAIVFTRQPRNATLQVGQPATFTFTATGTFPRTYQWRKDGVDIPGATNALYQIAAAATSDAGVYTVVGTNSLGSTISAGASLTVNAATPIVFHSASPADTTAVQGTRAALSANLSSGSAPITFQWLRNGAPIPGATAAQLDFFAVTLADAGRYSVTATNPAGSVTSREATLTVTPATPVTIRTHPLSQSVFQGQSISLSVNVSGGSQPIAFQWTKNGTPIPGATLSGLRLDPVALTDAGNYAVIVTNAAGSVTSQPAVITVQPAVAPTITLQPRGGTFPYYSSFSLSANVSGTSPLRFEWRRNGEAVGSGYSSYSVSSATPAHSGLYTLVISNAAGTVTSDPVTITVSPPAAPVITRQPQPATVSAGTSASFRVDYTTEGTGGVTFQWLKNGKAIPGADSSNIFRTGGEFVLNNVTSADEGDYAIVLTSIGGSVTSESARLTVLSATPPSIRSWPSSEFTNLGELEQFNVRNITGSEPLSIQWFKDGAPLAGQTEPTLYINHVAEADLGRYSVTISNAGGVIASPDFELKLYPVTRGPWTAAEQLGNIVYFLASSPHRIERYDLAADRWLPTTSLGDARAPTALLPTPEGVYLAYGRVLTRRSLDLTAETPLLNAVSDIIALFVSDQFLYYTAYAGATNSTVYTTQSFRRTNLEPGPSTDVPVHSAVFAPGRRTVFGMFDGGVAPRVFSVDAEGRLGAVTYNYSLENFPLGPRAILFPGEEFVANSAGSIFRLSDLGYAGSLGERTDDIVFLANNTPVALRGRTLQTIDPTTFLPTGSATLPFRGTRAFASGATVHVFGAPASSDAAFQVAKVTATSITPPAPPTVSLAPGERYSIDDAFLGADGVVHVLSRSKRALLRWSAITRDFLLPIPLRAAPPFASHTPGSRRALFAYHDGAITAVPLHAGAASEIQVNAAGNPILGVLDLGDLIFVNASKTPYFSRDLRLVLDNTGRVRNWSSGLAVDQRLAIGWDPATRRLFSGPSGDFDEAPIHYENVSTGGALSGPSAPVSGVVAPLRWSHDGAFIASANGRILDSQLAQVGVLANNIVDAAWLTDGVFTLRLHNGQTQLQRWSRTSHLESGALALAGYPVRVLRVSDTRVVVVTNTHGHAAFTLVDADLSVAGVSAPPTMPDFAGVYFGSIHARFSNTEQAQFALYVRPDRTAVLLIHGTGSSGEFVGTDVVINADGSFLATATGSISGQQISGTIAADGNLTGLSEGPVTGARSSGASSAAGYYFAPGVGTATGGAYAIVGGDGRTLAIARNPRGTIGGIGLLDSAGRLTVAGNSDLTATFTIASGTFTATADRAPLAETAFVGLRDDMPRTDRLANISTRGRAGAGEDAMIAGFVVAGAAPRPVLIRAIGPALSNFGVNDVLPDPKLTLFSGMTRLMESNDWSSESGVAAISATSPKLGAFALPNPGKDAVLLATLPPGNYTAQVTAATGSGGVSLVEVYDAGEGSVSETTPRLINIATRGRVGAGEDLLIAGIVVSGNVPKRVLIRAVGPALQSFGVAGALSDPVLTLLSGNQTLLSNDDWNEVTRDVTGAQIAAASVSVGAFALPLGSRDAALLTTLAPGNYTAQVSGKSGATGIALVEVYEVAP